MSSKCMQMSRLNYVAKQCNKEYAVVHISNKMANSHLSGHSVANWPFKRDFRGCREKRWPQCVVSSARIFERDGRGLLSLHAALGAERGLASWARIAVVDLFDDLA
jgi:hypothetical protein